MSQYETLSHEEMSTNHTLFTLNYGRLRYILWYVKETNQDGSVSTEHAMKETALETVIPTVKVSQKAQDMKRQRKEERR